MTPEQYQRVREIFLKATEARPADRAAVARRLCRHDPELLDEVLSLLSHHHDEPTAINGGPHTQPEIETMPPASRGQPTRLLESELDQQPGANLPAQQPVASPLQARSALQVDHGRFEPGAIVAGRYRIVALIGRGGMGEVYRADDLVLGQSVALKFLPPLLATNPALLESFLNEVRIARQVSHPNVVRFYDIGTHDSDYFISMEYVEGETLHSFLSRIGRLPARKAAQIAAQLCAGLGAIHQRGVLHRDLKPANILIDHAGNTRVTDFGLASVGHKLTGALAAAGTPGYIAPEAIEGREATVQSDIYALGLILYELFTGRAAYPGHQPTEILRDQRERDPAPPSAIDADIDERLEAVILRCLDRDPRNRPARARDVAIRLPGTDALAAAMAAGETPSPEAVAAAGQVGSIKPLRAVAVYALFLVFLSMAVLLAGNHSLVARVPLEKPVPALKENARRILTDLGYDVSHGHEVAKFDLYEELLDAIAESDPSPLRWDILNRPRPSPIDFWYRFSPVPFEPPSLEGLITYGDPPRSHEGMISVRLSLRGELRELIVTPTQAFVGVARTTGDPAEVDWGSLMRAANLDIERMRAVQPERIPPSYADQRVAWAGVYPESEFIPIRVEAAALAGRPVFFRIVEDQWAQASFVAYGLGEGRQLGVALQIGVSLLGFIGAAFLARHNVISRRADRRGAYRIAFFIAPISLLAWFFTADHTLNVLAELRMLLVALAITMLFAVLLWTYYTALEPSVRRWWPETLIAWTRLLNGGWKDPLVGRTMLMGTLLGSIGVCTIHISHVFSPMDGSFPGPPPFHERYTTLMLDSPRTAIGGLFAMIAEAVYFSMFFLLALVLLRLATRSRWAAMVIYTVLQGLLWILVGNTGSLLSWVMLLSTAALCTLFLVRFGLLALTFGAFTFFLLVSAPMTVDPSRWHLGLTVMAVGTVAAMATTGLVLVVRRASSRFEDLDHASAPLSSMPR